MADYFFDTSVLVAYFKKEDARTHDLFERILAGQVTAAISAITVAELWSVSDMLDQKTVEERGAVIALFEIVPIDHAIAQRAGELRRAHNLHLPDALIAASCIAVGARFYSKDSHFERLILANVLQGAIYGT